MIETLFTYKYNHTNTIIVLATYYNTSTTVLLGVVLEIFGINFYPIIFILLYFYKKFINSSKSYI